jgi:predicted nucleic acid-binding protein
VIVVDSSVWIDFFNGAETPEVDRLDELLGEEPILVGDLILAEVLQGFRHDADYRAAHRALRGFHVVGMVDPDLAVRSADNYRSLRKRGVTVRKTIDSLIATFCIENDHPLLFSDWDFQPYVEHLGLTVASRN